MKAAIFTKIVFLFALLSISTLIYSQGNERPMKTTENASQIYFELGGPGIIYSFNYDGRFGKHENGIGMRVGMGGAAIDGNGYFALPVQINYLIGTKGKYFEIGGGVTYAPGLELFDSENPTYGTLAFGFRKQPLGKKGFAFRVAFTPIIGFGEDGPSFLPFAGVSWGFRF